MASSKGATRRTVIVGFIMGLHVLFIIGLSAGLNRDMVKGLVDRIQMELDEQEDKAPPPPPPPPPEDFVPPQIELPPSVDLPQLVEAPTNQGIDVPSQPVQPKAEPVVQAAPILAPTKAVNYFRKNKPPFPSASRRLQEEGSAVVQITIAATGEASCTVLTSSGFERLDEAAVRWCSSKKFDPATQGGNPVPYSFKLKYTFKLEDE